MRKLDSLLRSFFLTTESNWVGHEDYEFIDFVADKVPELQAICQTGTIDGWNGAPYNTSYQKYEFKGAKT